MGDPPAAGEWVAVGGSVLPIGDAYESPVYEKGEASFGGAEPYDRISWVSVARLGESGRDSAVNIGGQGATGELLILAVAADGITAEIDVTDDSGSVKGRFTARPLEGDGGPAGDG